MKFSAGGFCVKCIAQQRQAAPQVRKQTDRTGAAKAKPGEQRLMRLTLNYRTRIITSLSEVGQAAWDGLLARQADANPFLSHAFLHALHESGSASRKSGWRPHYL